MYKLMYASSFFTRTRCSVIFVLQYMGQKADWA